MKTFRVQSAGDSHKHVRADQMLTLPSGHTQFVRHRNIQIGNVCPDQNILVMQTVHEVVMVVGPGNLLCAEIELDDWAEEPTAGGLLKHPASAPTVLRSVDSSVPRMWRDAKLDPPTIGQCVLAFDELRGRCTAWLTLQGEWAIWNGAASAATEFLSRVSKWRELPEGP